MLGSTGGHGYWSGYSEELYLFLKTLDTENLEVLDWGLNEVLIFLSKGNIRYSMRLDGFASIKAPFSTPASMPSELEACSTAPCAEAVGASHADNAKAATQHINLLKKKKAHGS